MFNLDFSDFERKAVQIGLAAEEVPFALANALTYAAYRAKDALVTDVWPRHVKSRNNAFLKRALRVVPAKARDFREGRAMAAEVYDDLGHVDLIRLARGGVKRAAHGGNLAVPTSRVGRSAGGAVRSGQKPRALKRVIRKGGLLFQAEGKGRNSRLRLMYKLQPNARIKPTVPFYSEWDRLMRAEVYKAFPNAVRNVLKRNARAR